MTTTSLPDAIQNVDYGTERLTATGGQGSYVWALASGSLPTGLSLAANGDITGIPMVGETSNFTVQVTSSSQTSQRALSIEVRRALQPNELCSENLGSDIVTFEDARLGERVSARLGVDALALTCGLVSGVTRLAGGGFEIESLVGIQNLTSLAFLVLNRNQITDISPLDGLLLTDLFLGSNSITDISALSGHPRLLFVDLNSNPNFSNIQPLLDNPEFGQGTIALLGSTNVSSADVAALRAKGVAVELVAPVCLRE